MRLPGNYNCYNWESKGAAPWEWSLTAVRGATCGRRSGTGTLLISAWETVGIGEGERVQEYEKSDEKGLWLPWRQLSLQQPMPTVTCIRQCRLELNGPGIEVKYITDEGSRNDPGETADNGKTKNKKTYRTVLY